MQNSCSTSDFTATMECRLRKVRTKQCTAKSKMHFSQYTKHNKSGISSPKEPPGRKCKIHGCVIAYCTVKDTIFLTTGKSSDFTQCIWVKDHGCHRRFHCQTLVDDNKSSLGMDCTNSCKRQYRSIHWHPRSTTLGSWCSGHRAVLHSTSTFAGRL